MTPVGATAGFTPKGQRTRTRIVDAAAQLIQQQGVVGTTLEDVKLAAEVSSSQLYHYFSDKQQLVSAVVDRQADNIVDTTAAAELSTTEGLRAWRDLIISHAGEVHGVGGCPLGSLGGQLAESDSHARSLVAAGFERWSTVLRDAMRDRQRAGQLAAEVNSDDLAVTLLAALQGGLLLAQVQRDVRPLETTLNTLLTLAGVA